MSRPSTAPARVRGRDGSPGEANVLVCVRVRPQNAAEAGKRCLVEIVDANCVCFDPKSTRGDTAAQEGETATTKLQQRLASGGRRSREQFFKFDRVFGPEATQKEVFDTTAKGVIDSVLTGHNATVFAYGATGS
eukprot:COSAG01_NODE_12156_length_1789_cov_6.102246_1_plen_133_part_10